MPASQTIGVLLLNVGTPDAPTPEALHRYLDQFLSDPRVIDYPDWLWQPILQRIILQVRPPRSAELYARIWQADGSPLISTTRRLAASLTSALQTATGDRYVVELGMRYGKPSIEGAFARLHAAAPDQLVILPLFPQYSDTTTGTSLEATEGALPDWAADLPTHIIRDYHDHPVYIAALADSVRDHWRAHHRARKLMLSYHGIPARYRLKGDPYREQCERTAALLASALGLSADEWQVTFQSRFGPEPWLKPYTDKTLQAWGSDSVKDVQAICPGFAIDCLETVDEIGTEGGRMFKQAGGHTYSYIPALNDSPAQVRLLSTLIREALPITAPTP